MGPISLTIVRMEIDASQFERIVQVVFGGREQGYRDQDALISPEEAEAIIGIAQLAVDLAPEETALFETLVGYLRALGNVTGPRRVVSPDDTSTLVATLLQNRSAMLAWVVANLVAIADLQLATSESAFVSSLRAALSLGPEADDVMMTVNEILLPAE